MDKAESVKDPSKLKYIGVFILFGILQNVLSAIFKYVLIITVILMSWREASESDAQNTFFVVLGILNIFIYTGTFILIYSIFSTLNIRKVIRYVYILGTFGAFYTIWSVKFDIGKTSQDLTILYWSTVLSFVVGCLLIRSYYVKKVDRWH